MNDELHLFLGDQHIPYHDRDCEQLTLGFIEKYKPGTIHLLGDLVDFYGISSHLRDPQRKTTVQADADAAFDYLSAIRSAAPKAQIHLSEGNHEFRLQRYLWGHAPELSDLRALRVPTLLRLADLGLKWHPESAPYKQGHLWVKHGNRLSSHSAYTARLELERVGASVIIGHTHRAGVHYKTQFDGTIVGLENACLCKIDPSVHRYTHGPPNWQLAFTVAQFIGPRFAAQQVSILGKGKKAGYIFRGEWHGLS